MKGGKMEEWKKGKKKRRKVVEKMSWKIGMRKSWKVREGEIGCGVWRGVKVNDVELKKRRNETPSKGGGEAGKWLRKVVKDALDALRVLWLIGESIKKIVQLAKSSTTSYSSSAQPHLQIVRRSRMWVSFKPLSFYHSNNLVHYSKNYLFQRAHSYFSIFFSI